MINLLNFVSSQLENGHLEIGNRKYISAIRIKIIQKRIFRKLKPDGLQMNRFINSQYIYRLKYQASCVNDQRINALIQKLAMLTLICWNFYYFKVPLIFQKVFLCFSCNKNNMIWTWPFKICKSTLVYLIFEE